MTAIIFTATYEAVKIIGVLSMQTARLVRESHEVDARLSEFGVTRQELVDVVRAVVAARADAVEDDPASAEGQFAYIFGTRVMRQVFKSHGWLRHRENNVESVRHPNLGLTVTYQSVDMASDWMRNPRAISGKGSGADRFISSLQGNLFSEDDIDDGFLEIDSTLKRGAWFLCVSVDGEEVRAELSLPRKVANGNFESFIERIFVVHPGEWADLNLIQSDPQDVVEFEPTITRKQ